MEVNRNEYYAQISQIMAKDEANKYCFECKRQFPKYVSINNGIFLCNFCAEEHKALGVGISFIRSLYEIWDEYLYLFIYKGGNRRLSNIFKTYNIDISLNADTKYRTKAAEYYRILV
jgi:predicted amidophosphoribosyltransferase